MIKLTSFVIFSAIILYSFFRSVINVKKYEIKRYEDFRRKGEWGKIKESIIYFSIFGICSLVAAKYSELQIVWLIAGIIFLIFAGFSLFTTVVKYLKKIPSQEVPALNEAILKRNISKRKKIWIFQILLLLLWVFSWRNIFEIY